MYFYYKNKYQITNPYHVSTDANSIQKIFSSYKLTDGLTEKKYNTVINEVLKNIPDLNEWLNKEILKKFNNITWKNAILDLHNPKNINKKGNFLNRLILYILLRNYLFFLDYLMRMLHQ